MHEIISIKLGDGKEPIETVKQIDHTCYNCT